MVFLYLVGVVFSMVLGFGKYDWKRVKRVPNWFYRMVDDEVSRQLRFGQSTYNITISSKGKRMRYKCNIKWGLFSFFSNKPSLVFYRRLKRRH